LRTRNTVDALDAACESIREALPRKYQQLLKTVSLEPVGATLQALSAAVEDAKREAQPLLVRVLWALLYRSARFEEIQARRAALDTALKPFGKFSVPVLTDKSLAGWQDQLRRLAGWLTRAQQFKTYLNALKHLQLQVPFEAIVKQRTQVFASMRENALQLWERWVRLRPTTLSSANRQMLQPYQSVLKLAASVKPGHPLEPAIERQYREVFTKAGHLLPCWAATSLSVRGRVPFLAAEFDLVVFDEASQCDIASALPLLYRAKRAVVIGDPQQLSHISGLRSSFNQLLMQRFRLSDIAQDWSFNNRSLFDLARSLIRPEQVLRLKDHHRSHADIIGFSNKAFYGSQLRIATGYAKLKLPPSGGGVRWIDAPGEVLRTKAGVINRIEAHALVQAMRELLASGYRGSLGVVSPFRAQANLIREIVAADSALTQRLAGTDCLIDTVHKFQGDERDVVFFSPVLSAAMPSSAEAFLRKNGNLFNVAITRARAQLVVVGDFQCSSSSTVPYLVDFTQYVEGLKDRLPVPLIALRAPGSRQSLKSASTEGSIGTEALDLALAQAGLVCVARYREEKYSLDLALLYGGRRLDIEVDEAAYHTAWTLERCHEEQIRSQRLNELGWEVLRFWVYEIQDDLPGCVARVMAWAERAAP
jgi:hypothetical protein